MPTLNDAQINQLASEAFTTAKNNEDIDHLRTIMDSEPDDIGLTSSVATFAVNEDGTVNYTNNVSEDDDDGILNASILDDDRMESSLMSAATTEYDLDDDEAAMLLDAVMSFKRDKNCKVYDLLPPSVLKTVEAIRMENMIPVSEKEDVARAFINQFIEEASTDVAFADFESALDKAMKIPSLTDMYNEYLTETIDVKLPKMADAIRSEDPEKADMLIKIGTMYRHARTYDLMRAHYDSTARIRKLVRRDYADHARHTSRLNHTNVGSTFNMSDADEMYPVLYHRLIETDPSTDITEDDIAKFITLICESLSRTTPVDVSDFAYGYYMLKNISMLMHYNDDAKSFFGAELMSNIKVMIYYIRHKESEANVQTKTSDHREKRSKRKRSKK